MYNTAETLEALDMVTELLSYETVCNVSENHQIWDEDLKDADFHILVTDFSEIEQFKALLLPLGYVAYIDDDATVLKISN